MMEIKVKVSEDLFVLKRLAEKSKLSEEEALELGRFINKRLAKRYEKFLK